MISNHLEMARRDLCQTHFQSRIVTHQLRIGTIHGHRGAQNQGGRVYLPPPCKILESNELERIRNFFQSNSFLRELKVGCATSGAGFVFFSSRISLLT
jgi:hypothetical protein